MVTKAKFKVSVCMTAFNQEAFIRQAIDSVLAQKTDFPVELVISDDCSSDGTPDICAEMAGRYPDKIRYIPREHNLGMMGNFIATLDACDGEYVAICEGDDYWIDCLKLQRQAEIMDEYRDVSLCCHAHITITDGRQVSSESLEGSEVRFFDGHDYLNRPFSHTASFLFRNSMRPRPFPDWYKELKLAGDHFLVLFLSTSGRIAYLKKEMSAFRRHAKSYSNRVRLLELKEDYFKNLDRFDEYSSGKLHDAIEIVKKRWELIYHVYEPKRYWSRLLYFFSNLDILLRHFRPTEAFRVFLRYLVPVGITMAIRRSVDRNG